MYNLLCTHSSATYGQCFSSLVCVLVFGSAPPPSSEIWESPPRQKSFISIHCPFQTRFYLVPVKKTPKIIGVWGFRLRKDLKPPKKSSFIAFLCDNFLKNFQKSKKNKKKINFFQKSRNFLPAASPPAKIWKTAKFSLRSAFGAAKVWGNRCIGSENGGKWTPPERWTPLFAPWYIYIYIYISSIQIKI